MVLFTPGVTATDGNEVIAGAGGAYAGAGNLFFKENPDITAYKSTRTLQGWATSTLTPSATEYSASSILAAGVTHDGSVGDTLWAARKTNNGPLNEKILFRTGGNSFVEIGPGLGPEVTGEEVPTAEEELSLVGASDDLQHSLYEIHAFGSAELHAADGRGNLWPGDTTNEEDPSLYEYSYTPGDGPLVRPQLVGVSDSGSLISKCGTILGAGEKGSAYNAVSEDGNTVFFTSLACRGANEPHVDELYARVDGNKTVAVSEPSVTACPLCNTGMPSSAIFEGASRDGERAFFLTEQELNSGQTGEYNLYEDDLGANNHEGKISLVSMGTATPEVQGVVRVSENGEYVYFVAKGRLTSEARGGGCLGELTKNEREEEEATGEGRCRPKVGADNLYVYEPDPGHQGSKHVVFVATLLTATEKMNDEEAENVEVLRVEEKGLETLVAFLEIVEKEFEHNEISLEQKEALVAEAFEEFTSYVNTTPGKLGPHGTVREDESVWQIVDRRPVQVTQEGNFLVFPSSADLTTGDDSEVPQLFEYSAASEALTRVSIGDHNSYNSDGNVKVFSSSPQIPAQSYTRDLPFEYYSTLAITSDGSRIFFTSADQLSPLAEAGTANVYEYEDGDVYLISSGRDTSLYEDEPTVKLVGSDPSGKDVFFVSAETLVPNDGDTQMVLYDAREEGGFPVPVMESGCFGETCRGNPEVVSSSPVVASEGQADGHQSATTLATGHAKSIKKKVRKRAKISQTCGTRHRKSSRSACNTRAKARHGGSHHDTRLHTKFTHALNRQNGGQE